MWEDLLKIGEGAWESVSEGAETYINVWAETKAQSDAEDRKNPDMLNQATPDKGMRTDGSTIVSGQGVNQAQPTIISGVSNTVLMVGGALFIGLLFVLKD